MDYILAADIGGTKLATGLYDENVNLLSSIVIPSESTSGEKLFTSLVDSFALLCKNASVQMSDVQRVSVGLPGVLDVETGIILYQNNLPWKDFPLHARLMEVYAQADIVIDNDANMSAWGEYATRGYTDESLVYVTLSTGISCCTIDHGRFSRGAGMAGEIGFSLMEDLNGTLEDLVSGPALEARGRKLFNQSDMTLKEMMAFYYEGDERMIAVMNDAVKALAKEIHHILVYSDPHCIVLGGGVFNHHPKLVEAVRNETRQYLQHPLLSGKETRIEGSLHKGEAGLVGAALRMR